MTGHDCKGCECGTCTCKGEQKPEPGSMEDIFGPPIYKYTRSQAIEDGMLVDTEVIEKGLAKEKGFKIPVCLTTNLYEKYIEVKEGMTGDTIGRACDVLWMAFLAIRANKDEHATKIPFKCIFGRKTVTLIAAMDSTDGYPAIVLMLPEDD